MNTSGKKLLLHELRLSQRVFACIDDHKGRGVKHATPLIYSQNGRAAEESQSLLSAGRGQAKYGVLGASAWDTFDTGALVALRGHCVLRREQGLRLFPRTFLLYLLCAGQVSLDEAEHFPASLRSDSVRDYSGMPFPPERAFSFTGIHPKACRSGHRFQAGSGIAFNSANAFWLIQPTHSFNWYFGPDSLCGPERSSRKRPHGIVKQFRRSLGRGVNSPKSLLNSRSDSQISDTTFARIPRK
jgi:hypothetical protein